MKKQAAALLKIGGRAEPWRSARGPLNGCLTLREAPGEIGAGADARAQPLGGRGRKAIGLGGNKVNILALGLDGGDVLFFFNQAGKRLKADAAKVLRLAFARPLSYFAHAPAEWVLQKYNTSRKSDPIKRSALASR